jgi:hypothetical protein
MGKDSVTGLVNREPWKAYDIDEVDAAIAELKAENKMLKEHIANGDVSRITWIDEATELKAENEQLKAKLEDVQASAYTDSVDAGMRERRLKRALWLARAERAKEKQQLFLFSLGYEKLCIDGFYDPYSGRRELSPKQWIKAFNKVEVKLLKKAEEYE